MAAGPEVLVPLGGLGHDQVEAMGMEIMLFFALNGEDICARVSPDAGAASGRPMKLLAHMDHMHLIDPANQAVI